MMRMKSMQWLGLACALALSTLAGPVRADESTPPAARSAAIEYVAGEILVGFPAHLTQDERRAAARAHGSSLTGVSATGAYSHVAVPPGAEMEMAQAFAAASGAAWASPNFVARIQGPAPFPIPPNDPLYARQIHLHLINVEGAWAQEIGDPGVIVAVLDTGVAYENRPIPPYELPNVVAGATQYLRAPDLTEAHIIPGFDFVHDDPFPNDDNYHGTAVAAVIVQDTHNGFRHASIAPGLSILAIKTHDSSGLETLADVIDGINYAVANGADVINMSFSLPTALSHPDFDPFFAGLDAALEAAHDAGVVLVAANGNDGTGVVSRPAIHPDVIAVGASNFDGLTRSFYSQFSAGEAALGIPPTPGLPGSVELVAPVGDFADRDGNGLTDSVRQETIAFNDPESFGGFQLTGTSFAAPQVAAVAAAMISHGQLPGDDGIAVDILRQVLRDTARDLGSPGADLEFGAGQLDAAAALAATKVTICHVPPGNPGKARTIRVEIPSARDHLAKASTLGACP